MIQQSFPSRVKKTQIFSGWHSLGTVGGTRHVARWTGHLGTATSSFFRCTDRGNVRLFCRGEVGRTKAAHTHEPKASPLEPNPFGFICGSFATFERTVVPDAQRLIAGIAAAKDHQN